MSEETVSRKLCFLLEDGTVVFPCTMKNRETGKHTFRVSRFGGNVLNHADPKKREEEATEEEMYRYVCSGQLIPDSILRFSSAATGEMPPLNA